MVDRPWSPEQIDEARAVPFSMVLEHLGACHKLDHLYAPLDPRRRSKRVQVGYQGRDFIFTGPKFVNQLLPEGAVDRGGGGSIDFVRHLTGCNFLNAVKVCLDAINERRAK
ncbi:hypothetical protein [Burkholderia cepacia]|uniref:hypothetical protein n=1 Tax=Burkholderia cepacia TaxID=292 RepID=UPI000F5A71BE|nr:hypothetical protein [Burkholderia cepacia]